MDGVLSRLWLFGTPLCGTIVAVAPLWLPVADSGLFWLTRVLAVIAAVGIVFRRPVSVSARPPPSASPVTLLPLLALLFYSVIPAVAFSPLYPVLSMDADSLPVVQRSLSPGAFTLPGFALASSGERAVLAFCGCGILWAFVLDHLVPEVKVVGRSPSRVWSLALIVGGGLIFQIAKASALTGPSASLSEAVPAVVILGLVLQLGPIIVGDRQADVSDAIAVGAAGLLLWPYQTKTFVLALGALSFAAFVVGKWRRRLALTGLMIAMVVVSAITINVSRGIIKVESAAFTTAETLRWKVVVRQTETVFCLAVALRDRAFSAHREPWYFAAAVIPRVLWPAKPNISNGSAYGQAFCGLPAPLPNGPVHSASVTLIGEPWIEAGAPGMGAAAICLAMIAAGMTWAWKRGPSTLGMIVLALSPWFIDFDQHFSMWLGNLGKSTLAMLFVGAAIEIAERYQRGSPT